MIYVIQTNGKGAHTTADTVKFLTFLSMDEFSKFKTVAERKSSDGHKYWVRFDVVEPGDEFEPVSE